MRIITCSFISVLLGLLAFYGAFAEGIRHDECPKGKALLFVETTRFNTPDARQVYASVAVQGKNLIQERSLKPRSDGWTNLSSERDQIFSGGYIANCLPLGMYLVRIEYYIYLQWVGDWHLMTFEYAIDLDKPITIEPLRGGGESMLIASTPQNYFKRYAALLSAYLVASLVFVIGTIALMRHLTKERKRIAKNISR